MRVPRPIVLFALAAAAAAAGGCGNGSRGKTGVNLIQARYGHTQTTLPDGRVVLIGGVKRSDAGTRDTLVSEVEVFDPTTLTTSIVAGGPEFRKAFHAAAFSDAGTPTDPSDDYILFAGGLDRDVDNLSEVARSAYRLSTATWAVAQAADLPHETFDNQAVTLADGRVAFVGGRNAAGGPLGEITVYDAGGATNTVEVNLVGNERWNHRAVFVPDGGDGYILISGGRDDNGVEANALLYDVAARAVVAFVPILPRQYHTLTYLDNGTPADVSDDAVIETGGLDDIEEVLGPAEGDRSDIEVYRINGGAVSYSYVGNLPRGTFFHAAASAASGTAVVVTGGFNSIYVNEDGVVTGDFIDSDPIRQSAILKWQPATNTVALNMFYMAVDRAMHASSPLADGRVLVTGGINDDLNSNAGIEIVTVP